MQTFYGPISNELFFFFFFKGYCFGGFFGRKLGNEAIDTMQSLRTGPPSDGCTQALIRAENSLNYYRVNMLWPD